MSEPGETRERRYRNRKLVLLGASAVLSGLGGVVIGIAGDGNVVFAHDPFPALGIHLPFAARIAVGVTFLATLMLVARINWLTSDEVRRSHLLSFWAAIGFAAPLTFLGFLMFGSAIPEASRLPLAFILPVVMGSLFAAGRWLRDGFVW